LDTKSGITHWFFVSLWRSEEVYFYISLYFRRIWSIIVSSSKQKIVPVIESSSSDNFIIISSTYLFIIWKVSEIIDSSVLFRFWLFLTRSVGVRGVQQLQQCKQTGSDLIILIHLFRLIFNIDSDKLMKYFKKNLLIWFFRCLSLLHKESCICGW